jgi:hypothetical protein
MSVVWIQLEFSDTMSLFFSPTLTSRSRLVAIVHALATSPEALHVNCNHKYCEPVRGTETATNFLNTKCKFIYISPTPWITEKDALQYSTQSHPS